MVGEKNYLNKWVTSDTSLLHFEHDYTLIICVVQVNIRALMSNITYVVSIVMIQ